MTILPQPQDEDNMDGNDKQTLKRAKECQEHGESIVATIKDPKNYEPFIESLTHSLLKRESVLGRYNHITAQSYSALGDVYLQMNEPRAVVMYRTCFRIHTFLYGKCNGHISGAFRDVLSRQRGLSQQEIEEVRSDVLESMKFEMEGDLLRRLGDWKAAVREYQKAARVEEFAFGRDNPDLAFICRKMACLASIKKGATLHHVLDFEEADRLGHKWMKNSKESLSPSTCAYIRKGDKYYESLLYGHAVSEYLRATMIENNLDRKSKSGKHKQKGSNAAKKEKQTEAMAEELRLFLSGKLQPKAADATTEQSNSNHEGIYNGGAPMEPNRVEDRALHHRGHDTPKKSPRPSRIISASNDTNVRPKDRLNDVAPPPPRSPEMSPSKVSEAIRKFEKERATDMEVSTKPLLAPPTPKAESRSIVPPPPKASPAQSLKSTRSSRSSSSKRRGKPNQSLSESSLMTLMKPPSYLEPKKPKSDSYITKIAQKTTKLAKTHLKSQLQRSRSSSSSKDKTKSGSSFLGSLRKERSNYNTSSDDATQDAVAAVGESSSSTYLLLGSPPMTPYHQEQGGDKDLGLFFRESIETQSMSSFQKAPLDSPSKKGSRASGENADQDESIANSNFLFDQHREEQEYQEEQDHDEESSTEPLKLPHESLPVLDNFFDKEQQKPSAQVFSSMDTQSVMTSDESIMESFLNETEKMTTTILNNKEEEPSLVNLVAHVQKMSALLQRQTFRLQHKLGDAPAASSTSEGDIQKLPAEQLPHGTVELCKEVERLFGNCDETLEQAFSRLDDTDGDGSNKKNAGAMEDYRKTFALEQVFLNDLRKGVNDVLAQYSMSATTSTDGEYFQGNSLSSSGDMLFDLPRFSSNAADPENSAGSILEESMLSVVFEDNSKSTSSPSDHPQKLRLL
jgi:tetratricopeptide (TPR) repeat protein